MSDTENTAPAQQPKTAEGMVRCALTGKEIPSEEAYWAPPLVTFRQLLGTVMGTLMRTPSNLGHVLFDEQADVPYAPDARDELASRRTAEQLKLLLFLLLVVGIIVVPIVLLVR